MARNPISRAITNAAAEMRKGRPGAYRFDIPKEYLKVIDRENIKRMVDAGVPLATAAKAEIANYSAFILVKNASRDKEQYHTGAAGLEFLAKIAKWNRQLQATRINYRRATGEELPENAVYRTDIAKVKNIDKVMDMIDKTTPYEVIQTMYDRAQDNIVKSMKTAGMPSNLISKVQEAMIGLSPKQLSKLFEDHPFMVDMYSSDQMIVKTNISEFLIALGLASNVNKGSNKNPLMVMEFSDDIPEAERRELEASLNSYTGFTVY